MRKPPNPGPAPTETSLHEAALSYLARFAATEAGLVRVLERKIDRWARLSEAESEQVAACRAMARAVSRRLVASGLVNDAVFAETRAAALTRSGRSRRAVAAHLAARGVDSEMARDAVPDNGETELAAALTFARRRRIGPFRREQGAVDDMKALGMLARAGFAREVAMQALGMAAEEAEALVTRLKQS